MKGYQKKIWLLTSDHRFYGQSRKVWMPIDTDKVHRLLNEGGYEVIELEYHQAVHRIAEIRDNVILYSFSQITNIRDYLKDLAQILLKQNNLLIPSYEMLLCHENKGYQELYKQQLGIDDLKAFYLSSGDETDHYNIVYPVVLKSVGGSNAKGVHLVHDKQELLRTLKMMDKSPGLLKRLDILRRKLFRSKHQYKIWNADLKVSKDILYKRHFLPRTRFVLQEFIPGLDGDFRVIAMHDKYFVSKRLVRPGDWRASGTKLFTYDNHPNADILNYAKNIYDRVNLPVLAMDLGQSTKSIHLFEFQASHFGITPIQSGPGYFTQDGANWVFHHSDGKFEDYLAQAVLGFLEAKVFNAED